ncbi:MAG: acyl-CoA dehydrogenase [Anaerolineae bacterium]|nr:MAG: acyl-CoA dehydrogenase [Anaerolineae bacterium]
MRYDDSMNMKINYEAVELARALATDIVTRADAADRDSRLPSEDVAALRNSGYLALAVPEALGGRGASPATCVAAQLELAQGSASTALVAAMQHQVIGHQRETQTWRTDAYEKIGGLPETTATPGSDGWLVNGHKTWATGGRHLTHLLVRVAAGDASGVVLVRQGPEGVPGLEWIETWRDVLSLRASDSHDAIFRNVSAPNDALIETGDARAVPNVWFPMMLSAVYLGAATAARDALIRYALERVPTALGKPIATLPKIQRQIGEIDVPLMAARALLLEVATWWTGREEDRVKMAGRIAAAKLAVTSAANEATEKALMAAGGAGITRALPLERIFRDVRAANMQPPSGDTAYEMVGRAALGM